MVAGCWTIERQGHDAWLVRQIEEAGIGRADFALLLIRLWIGRMGMEAVGRSPRVCGLDEG